jgi:hypothetical protein
MFRRYHFRINHDVTFENLFHRPHHALSEETINCSACFDLGRIAHANSSGYLHTHSSSELRAKKNRRYANLRNCPRRVFFFWNLGHALAVDDRRNLKGGKDRGDRDPHGRARHESSWTYPTAETEASVGRLYAGVEEPLRSESKRLGKNRLVVQHSPKLQGFNSRRSAKKPGI